jgi:prolyl-tRNA synthetase
MKLSKLFLKTLREDPQDAEVASHKLLLRAGYIHRISSGVYSYLPLGLKVLLNLENIIRDVLNKYGAQEILMPALTPIELWQESGRDKSFGDLLPAFLLEARSAKYVLGPTHEEVVTKIVSQLLDSYKSLPVCLYQIQSKFRDEARPRFGLLRTKELIMCDAYSFDEDKTAMANSYEIMLRAYEEIFKKIGLKVYAVEALSGAIGGDVNHEFMVKSAIGEDFFAECLNCGYRANLEAAMYGEIEESVPSEASVKYHETKNAKAVSEVILSLKDDLGDLKDSQLLKTMVCLDYRDQPVLCLIPGDRELREQPDLRLANDSDFKKHPLLVKGFVGPMDLKGYKIVADFQVKKVPLGGYIAGANKVDYHVSGLVPGRDFKVDEWRQLSKVKPGDTCPKCGSLLEVSRCVEAAHTFQLGLTYSSKMKGATFITKNQKEAEFWMGCYGIGVSRLLAVVAEAFCDEKGLVWPPALAPFMAHIVALSYGKNNDVKKAADKIYESLAEQGISALMEDRPVSTGVAFSDAELLGMPVIISVGQKSLEKGVMEVRLRSSVLSGYFPALAAKSGTLEMSIDSLGSLKEIFDVS